MLLYTSNLDEYSVRALVCRINFNNFPSMKSENINIVLPLEQSGLKTNDIALQKSDQTLGEAWAMHKM
jgi:hypothetical protein